MKKILLSSVALIGLAGYAAAEAHTGAMPGVTFTGSVELGYNEDSGPTPTTPRFDYFDNNPDGFYSELSITIGLSKALDNGLTAAASIDLADFSGNTNGVDYELSLTTDNAGLYYGDTTFAAENMWKSAGDMESDGFSEADGEEALRGEFSMGGVTTQVSYVLANNDGVRNVANDLNQLSIGASVDVGNFNIVAAYQAESDEAADFYQNEPLVGGPGAPTPGSTVTNGSDNEDFNDNELFGLSVGTSFAGADVRVAYAKDNTTDEDSLGLKVAYPFGPVTATAYYVAESEAAGDNYGVNFAYSDGPIAVALDYQDDQGTQKVGLEGSYDIGNGLKAYAGYLTEDSTDDRYYVAGTYDLGSGAELLVSYAEDDSNVDDDEIGAGEYQRGTTVEVTFEF